MQGGIKKGIITVFTANLINLIFNLLTNFLMPKYLSVEAYSSFKTFQLYNNYIFILSLGCAEGLYLRYGGKEIGKIDISDLKTSLSSFRTLMIIESLIFIPLSLISRDKIIIGLSLGFMSRNMNNYFKNLYQAVGEFKTYSRITNWTTIATFLGYMVLLLIIHTDDYFLYIISYTLVQIVIWLVLEKNMQHSLQIKNSNFFCLSSILRDIRLGFLLMIGNISNTLLSSIDRWFVKFMMDSTQFAYYSFAVSLEGFLNVAITPVTVTLYNYFCNHFSKKDITTARKYVVLFSTIIVAIAFPAKFVVEIYLNNYYESISVLFILFASQIVYTIVKGIYINLYKALKKQNLYFFRLILILAIGAILDYIFVSFYPCKEAFSYATLISSVIWLVISVYDFKQYAITYKESIYIIIEISVFIILGIKVNSIIGLLLYIIITATMIMLLMKYEAKALFTEIVQLINKKHTMKV